MDKSEMPFDLEEINKLAAQSIEDGAYVFKDYPLDVKKVCDYLNMALATELLCVLRYRFHQVMAKGMNYLPLAEEFEEHAQEEEEHMLMLSERIESLGGIPNFHPDSISANAATKFGVARDLYGMIQENLIAERIVIQIYRKLIELLSADSTTRKMLEKILQEEEEHASDLSNFLARKEELPRKKSERYETKEASTHH